MYRTAKYVVAAVFAMVLFAGAARAADDLFMPYDNSQSPDGRDEVIGGAPNHSGVSREQALEYAMPGTDAGARRTEVWNQPSRAHGGGVVADPSLAMPYDNSQSPDGRNE